MSRQFFFLRVFLFLYGILPSFAIPLCAKFPERDLTWKNLSFDRAANTVYSIFKDSNGIIWLGTHNGLFFYDGFSIHEVGTKEIGDFRIYALQQKDDKLFIGTNNGLFHFNYNSGEIKQENNQLTGEIRSLLLNGDNILIGSLYGIYKYNLLDNSIENLSEGLPNPSVYSILKDSRGILYVGTYNGIARWDSIEKHFQPVNIDFYNSDGIFINCLIETPDKKSIYVGGTNSLYKYTPSNDKWEKSEFVSGFNVKSLANNKNGHILIGTDDGLFDLFNDSIKKFTHDSRLPQSIANNEIWSILTDEHNNIFAGHERGFSIASNSDIIKNYNIGNLTNDGEGNDIFKILRDDHDNLWLGGSNGLILFPPVNSPLWFRHSNLSNSLSHNRIRDIIQTQNGNILLATDGGINRFDNKGGFYKYNISDSTGKFDATWAYSLQENGEDLLIGSFLGGILGLNKTNFKEKDSDLTAEISINSSSFPSIRNNLVNQITKDKDGNIWVLLFRDNALIKFNDKMEKISEFNIYELTGQYPSHMLADNKGRLWIGYKGGTIVFDNLGNYSIVNFQHSPADETILAMGNINNDIWISTRMNLWKIDGNSLVPSILPIPQKAFSAIYQDPLTGNVILGGLDEIVEIDMKLLSNYDDFSKFSLIVEDLGDGKWSFLNKDNPDFKLNLPHNGTLNLAVTTLNFSPEMVPRYMYKLAKKHGDIEGNWHILPEGSNLITLSNIKSGNYHLMIKTEGDSSTPLSIPLSVALPPALSWWAISLYIVSLLLILSFLIWYIDLKRKKKIEIKQRNLELKNAERKLSFLTAISHDLKTPLSMILGPVSLLKEQIKDKETQRNLNNIYENAVKLNSMIHKTLELQQMEMADDNLMIFSTLEIVEFCRGIFEVFKENNPKRNFVFFNSISAAYIEADAVKLESVINNLLSNACKYSFEGSTISLGISLENNNVIIIVSDDGIGIKEEDKSLIYQKLFRARSSSHMNEGTGIGLYLIRRYVELMNGTISLFSKPEEGSAFTVSLPVYQTKNEIISSTSYQNELNLSKILIVEDNLQISKFIQDLLKNNYSVQNAENGRTGLTLAASFMPDLIIVDEMMPVMSGLDMVKRIKENPKLSSVPILMLTAKTDTFTESESIKSGIDIFMPKPFEASTLIQRVDQLIKKRTEIIKHVRIQTIVENESKPIEAVSVTEKSIANIIKIIENNISEPDLNVEMLCKLSGLSNKNLYRLIKKNMGKAPLEFIRTVRLQKAAALLSQKRFTISEICYMVGFKTPSYFSKCFQNQFGISPSDYITK